MSEETPDPVATFDQEAAHMKGQATALGVYFKKLVAEGFERGEAMEIVHRWLDLQEPNEDSDER